VLDPKFSARKKDHIKIALEPEVQAVERFSLDRFEFEHVSLPELNLDEVQIETALMDRPIATPFFISGMTAGHKGAEDLNYRLAQAASERGWIFGLGSQRRELDEAYSDHGVETIVSTFSDLKLMANLGLAQLIEMFHQERSGLGLKKLERILQRSRAFAIAIHLNPLQEAIQLEGTPNFKHGYEALDWLSQNCSVPVIVKETGSGISAGVLERLAKLKLLAVDVSGLGGTHWGRVEGRRAEAGSRNERLGQTFKNWGIPTCESAISALDALKHTSIEVWGSGGIRTGLDAAKLLALGCDRIGFAQPALKSALQGEAELQQWMVTIEQELKIAMFCTGAGDLNALNESRFR
jgi:isopentenyl-diphosphate Delta-isomerase